MVRDFRLNPASICGSLCGSERDTPTMVREGNKLTALKVAKLTKPGRYGDGHGLWLQITKSGGKSWIMRYMLDGRPVYMGLGPLHAVSLAEARIRARQY